MAQRTTVRVRRHRRRDYGMKNERVASLGAILLRNIRSRLGGATSFRRDDLVRMGIFNYAAFVTQTQTVGHVVRYLVDQGELVEVSHVDLCLPNHVRHYSAEPLWYLYYDTVVAIIDRMKRNDTIGVMDVVAEWRTDQHITDSNKQAVVRTSMPRLVREGHLKQKDALSYQVTHGVANRQVPNSGSMVAVGNPP